MYTYIKKSIIGNFIESDADLSTLDGYGDAVGVDWEDYDNGMFLLLSSEQLAFRADHPEATVQEIWNMSIPKPPARRKGGVRTEPERTLDDAKAELHEAVNEYADSLKVFYVNDQPVWFEDRPSLKLQIDAEAMYGQENVTLYDGDGNAYTLPIADANNAIIAVEHYNTQCQDMIANLHAQIETIPSLEFADSIVIEDFTQNSPQAPSFTTPGYVPVHPDNPIDDSSTDADSKEVYKVLYKLANCTIDNDIYEVPAGSNWKSSVYPEKGLALYIPDFVATMGEGDLEVYFEPDYDQRPDYAAWARIEVGEVHGDIFVAGQAR